MSKELHGKAFADRGYISPKLFYTWLDDGIQLVHGIKTNIKNWLMSFYDKIYPQREYSIETIINKIGATRAFPISFDNEFTGKPSGGAGSYCFFENKLEALQGYYIDDSEQLALFYNLCRTHVNYNM